MRSSHVAAELGSGAVSTPSNTERFARNFFLSLGLERCTSDAGNVGTTAL